MDRCLDEKNPLGWMESLDVSKHILYTLMYSMCFFLTVFSKLLLNVLCGGNKKIPV